MTLRSFGDKHMNVWLAGNAVCYGESFRKFLTWAEQCV